MRTLSRVTLLLFLMLTLAGCIWLRLLETKNQLANFDDHFKVETTDHFKLHFLHPVLLSQDFVTLGKLQPSRIEKLPNGSRWFQIFHKIDSEGKQEAGIDIVFTLDFNEENQLISWDFSPNFMAMAPPQFFEASLRSLGKGKVDQGKNRVSVSPEDLIKLESQSPKLSEIIKTLGKPHEQTEEDHLKLYVYQFEVETPHIEEKYENRRTAVAKLYFNPANDDLVKMSGKFIGLKFSIDLSEMSKAGLNISQPEK